MRQHIKTFSSARTIKLVSIGGGTGQALLLEGLKDGPFSLTAIVTVLDNGRSSGTLRKDFDMVAPGDVRNCLSALADPSLKEFLQYRFKKTMEGMSLGNLVLAGLTEHYGSFAKAIEHLSNIFAIKGKVLPNTLTNTHICAELINGKTICGEVAVRKPNKPAIKRIYLKDKARAYPATVKAIKEADILILGPGSLYTSVLLHFLFPSIRKAFLSSSALKIFIPNLATQPGLTDGLTFRDHIEETFAYLTGKKHPLSYYAQHPQQTPLAMLFINKRKPPAQLLERYAKEGAHYLKPTKEDLELLQQSGIVLVQEDFLQHTVIKEWNKSLYMRHDSKKLAKAILALAQPKKRIKGVILAAGSGTRMKPFSLSTSKVMLEFLGKPLLAYHVEEMAKHGIKDIVIITNPFNHDMIKHYFLQHYPQLHFSFAVQEKQRGPAHALLSAESFLKHSYFLLRYGDSIALEDQIQGILDVFQKTQEPYGVVTLRDVDNPSEYGVARFKDGKLVEIVEKPKRDPPSSLANVGLTILDADLFFTAVKKHGWKNVLPPPQYLLMEGYPLSYWISRSERVDVGRAWNILQAAQLLMRKYGAKKESLHIHPTAIIDDTVYLGPHAVIEEQVQIKGWSMVDGYVGKGTIIENSVIMEGTTIGKHCIIKNSVIGKMNVIGNHFITKVGPAQLYVKDRWRKAPFPVGVFTGDHVVIKDKITAWPGKMVFPRKVITQNIKEDKLIRALLFDADNTLYQTKKIAQEADFAAMQVFAEHMFGDTSESKRRELYQTWRSFLPPLIHERDPKKRHRKYSYWLLLRHYHHASRQLLERGFQAFLSVIKQKIKPMPYLRTALPYLKQYQLALITEDTSDLVSVKLKALGLEDVFPLVITSDVIGEMKPSKKYYEQVFKRFGIAPNECVVIGDHFEKDLAIPKQMGATTILFAPSKATPEKIPLIKRNGHDHKKPDYQITNYKALLRLLREL